MNNYEKVFSDSGKKKVVLINRLSDPGMWILYVYKKILFFNKKKEINNTNEVEYLKQRAEKKERNINPWDKVISNIQLKEGEHKGVKDVSRMKHVILQRKTDFVQLKMK